MVAQGKKTQKDDRKKGREYIHNTMTRRENKWSKREEQYHYIERPTLSLSLSLLYICMYVCMYMYISTRVCIYIYICMYVCMYVCIYVDKDHQIERIRLL